MVLAQGHPQYGRTAKIHDFDVVKSVKGSGIATAGGRKVILRKDVLVQAINDGLSLLRRQRSVQPVVSETDVALFPGCPLQGAICCANWAIRSQGQTDS